MKLLKCKNLLMVCMTTVLSIHTMELKFPIIHRAPKNEWHDFLGYKIASPIGISACAVTTSKGIRQAARLGCDVLTYKTIRCHAWPVHPQPNIVYVDRSLPLTYDDIGKEVVAKLGKVIDLNCSSRARPELVEGYLGALEENPSTGSGRARESKVVRCSDLRYTSNYNQSLCSTHIAIANSFGNQSMDPEWTKKDIQKAKQSLLEGQVLIVSIFGNTGEEWIKTAQLAVEAGADIVEANYSCPNLNTQNEPIYTRPEYLFSITQALVKVIPTKIPLILKFGVFTDCQLMKQSLIAAAHAGAKGICGINTVPMKVVNADGTPTFGTRIFAGVSGNPIRELALDFIRAASIIIRNENLNLVLIGVGGITMASHFSQFFAAGATIALSAAGMICNPSFAAEYHEQSTKIVSTSRVNKEKLANKLFDIGVIKFGDFTFKSGIRSSNYIDMRRATSYFDVLHDLAGCLNNIRKNCHADLLCAVPYGAIPVTTALSMISEVPMIMARKEAKDHGTKNMIEGVYTSGQQCLIIEDVVTTGASILETIKTVEAAGLKVKDVITLINREQGGEEAITNKGYNFHTVFTLQELLSLLKRSNRINKEKIDKFKHYANKPKEFLRSKL